MRGRGRPTVMTAPLPRHAEAASRRAPERSLAQVALILVTAQIVSMQLGAVVAKALYDDLSPTGVAGIRLAGSALTMGLLVRPSPRSLTGPQIRTVLTLGVCLAAMNTAFFNAIQHVPIGVASALELLGPLILVLVLSRRAAHIAAGVTALGGTLLLVEPGGGLPLAGIALGLSAALARGAYVLLSRAVGQAIDGFQGITLALIVGALLVTPATAALDGRTLTERPSLLLPGLAVALLSSSLPYSLDLVALRRLPVQAFGVLLSLNPAVGAVLAFLILDERLNTQQLIALSLIVIASTSALLTANAPPAPMLTGEPHAAS